jgi:hypothetical protein
MKRFVERYETRVACSCPVVNLAERNTHDRASSLRGQSRAGMIHQQAPHLLSRYREEMGTILPRYRRAAEQFHIELMDERCRLQRVSFPFLLQVVGGETAQLLVGGGNKLLASLRITPTPGHKQGSKRFCVTQAAVLPCSQQYHMNTFLDRE